MSDRENTDIAIRVDGLSKSFRIPLDKQSGIKQAVTNIFQPNKGYREFQALKDVSFEIKKGEFFGIVGRNGSGKSTLLKILAGVYAPDEGGVVVNGSLTPFIELGVGFNPELSGRENVFLNGALLGFSREEMEAMYNHIVDFAELHDFMEERLKNYSSGMQIRLAFSIAICADTDILLLDEVLAVGDEAFQRKCNDYFADLKQKGKTVILVTHNMEAVRKYCTKAIMIREGEVVVSGSPDDIANEYSIENLESDVDIIENTQHNSTISNLKVELLSGKKLDEQGELRVRVSYNSLLMSPTKIRLSLQDLDRGVPIFATSSPLIYSDDANATLSTTLGAINDSNIKIGVSVQNENNETLHFLPDSKSPKLSFHRNDYPNPQRKNTWAVLFNRGEWK